MILFTTTIHHWLKAARREHNSCFFPRHAREIVGSSMSDLQTSGEFP